MIEFNVSPVGKDSNDGSSAAPFATVARAQKAVREALAAGADDDLAVLLADGRHELADTLTFDFRDSAPAGRSVTYAAAENAAPVLSGGRRITGWRVGEDGLWRTTLPDVARGGWYFRQLFVNGQRATRARTPNAGEYWHLVAAEFEGDYDEHKLWFEPGQLAAWRNVRDVEAVMYSHWVVTRKRLLEVDLEHNVARTQGPHFVGIQRPGAEAPFYFENALEFLDQPGEWYLDRDTGELTYMPRPGEDPQTAEVVAPYLTTLARIAGTIHEPVRGLTFRGLGFEHAAWHMPPEGHRPIQAGFVFPPPPPEHKWNKGPWFADFACVPVSAAVCWEYAHGCSLEDCRVAHTGATGVHLREGCRDAVLAGNELVDTGCNGILVGEYWRCPYEHNREEDILPGMVPTRIRIERNHVHHCAAQLEDGVGIAYTFAAGVTVARNHIHDLPYTGISAGFIWILKRTCCEGNVIERNHIHDVMLRMADGGGIYTLGRQPGSVLRKNLIHDIPRHPKAIGAPNNGIFMDEASCEFLLEGNVVYGSAGTPVRHNENLPYWQTWRDNTFCEEGRPDPATLDACEAGIGTK